jgi:hypothetical protein
MHPRTKPDFIPSLLNGIRHDGAMNMRLYRNDKLVCDRQAIYGQGASGPKLNNEPWETIEHYTSCDTIKLKAGDKIKMTSDYDLTKHRL